MPLNVIGLLNISIDEEEYTINQYMKLVSREYFEKEGISMPPEIRFYKTFIVSTGDFGEKVNIAKIPNEKKDAVPTYYLWAIKLLITKFNVMNSEWFAGETYEKLKEFMPKPPQGASLLKGKSEEWTDLFRIDKIIHPLDQTILEEITTLYRRIVELYKNNDDAPENINLHWLYAFTKFQECCSQPSTRYSVIYITSALEFLLVNSSNESDFRAAYYTALIYSSDEEERQICFNFLKWAFSVREKLSSGAVLSLSSFIDKSEIPENIHKLVEILAGVLLKTLGLSNKDLQEKLNRMMFNCPEFE